MHSIDFPLNHSNSIIKIDRLSNINFEIFGGDLCYISGDSLILTPLDSLEDTSDGTEISLTIFGRRRSGTKARSLMRIMYVAIGDSVLKSDLTEVPFTGINPRPDFPEGHIRDPELAINEIDEGSVATIASTEKGLGLPLRHDSTFQFLGDSALLVDTYFNHLMYLDRLTGDRVLLPIGTASQH